VGVQAIYAPALPADTSPMRIRTGGAALGLALAATGAMAQPVIAAIPSTAPNAEGWTNTVVRVEFDCARVSSCPQPQEIDSEGREPALEIG
jgi:hypothetical protein